MFVAQVTDGTFLEEPGSGVVETIENKKVSVGTLELVQRCNADRHWPWTILLDALELSRLTMKTVKQNPDANT
ncbi:unnamed protein product [Malus baccata var. baccata]